MSTLDPSDICRPLPRTANPVMAQIGWLGATGKVYGNDDDPSSQEPASFSPLYVQIGIWEDLGDGHWGIKD